MRTTNGIFLYLCTAFKSIIYYTIDCQVVKVIRGSF